MGTRIRLSRAAVLGESRNPNTLEGYPPIVGLDGEWKPGNNTPVSILQVATRTEVFVLDLLAMAPSESPACDALDSLLGDMLQSQRVYKLGFGFAYDLTRMKASYPHLRCLRASPVVASLVDVKELAYAASARRPPPLR